MMLYVFHVDVGRMMSFDMTVALSSVENLKATIERLHGIPAASIVLLVSGGELLTESTQVSCYSAGTDTNPIYMFLTGEVRVPTTMPQTDSDHDLRDQVERSMEMPAVYDTVVTRAQLALKMYEHAREEERLCERLVHDQHLQQQGWSAVVANMEDLTDEFRSRFRNFCTFFDSHLQKRGIYLDLLRNFSADLNKLSRIPILPGLMPLAEADFHGFDEYLDNDDVFSRSTAQQESVLMAGGTKSNTSETGEQLSTSPNKKAKMGEHAADGDNAEQPAASSTNSSKAASSEHSNTSAGAIRRITLNLLQWITSKENHNTLQIMSEECVQGLGTFNDEVYEKLKNEVHNIIKVAEQGDVKEIKGLGERLMKLEEFKYKVKNMVQDQKELSTAFQQNQNRAINLRDPSILPDLCASHRSQLQVMLQNHRKILEHRRCIAKAKDELGTNLHMRLGRIVCIENAMSDYDNRLLFYHRCLKRAERHISIIEQIHQAPCIYVAAVTEVVRRKIFSEEFRTWASKLSDDFDSIHSEEIKRREVFNANFDGHFLNILFPGMNDMPPAFANENPLAFDGRLPNLTKSDIDMLSSYLPDLAAQINLPDMQPVIRFFVSRSGEHQKARWEQLLKAEEAMDSTTSTTNVAAIEKPQNQRLLELQKAVAGGSSRTSGCDESETDTEIEFEKVAPETTQVPAATDVQTSTEAIVHPETLDRSTITEVLKVVTNTETLTDENESATRQELERVREALRMLSQHSMECIRLARANLVTVRSDVETYRDDLQADIKSLQDTCKMLQLQSETREKELLALNEAKQTEVDELKHKVEHRDIEIEKLKEELQKLEEMQLKCYSLEEKLAQIRDEIDKEKETAVALAREELIHEHKTEIESLRCRFKLMTSMERSPSDMSLEKIERPTSRSAAAEQQLPQQPQQPTQETLLELQQLEENLKTQYEAEKEKAINAAIEAERALWQSRLMLNSESVIANVGMLKVIEEKERQLEQLREREFMLTKENFQLKTRLDALTNEDANSWLKEKIEYLNRDKERLEKELEKSKRLEMEGSFAAGLRGPLTEHTLPRSKSSNLSQKYAVLQSLEKGDVVFVIWSTTYGQYIVFQVSQSLFFVHGESLAGLKLRLPKREIEAPSTSGAAAANDDLTIPSPYYAIGIVLEKEYCQARKDKNRYRVPCGSKFYRVKLAPITIVQPIARAPRDRLESFSKSVSRSVSQCESQSEALSSAALALTGLEASVVQTIELTTSTAVTLAASPTTDTVDGAVGAAAGVTATASNKIEDEVTLLTERCRYASVSEEDELAVTSTTTTTTINNNNNNTTAPQKQSVITEQPTASNKLKLDLSETQDTAESANIATAATASEEYQTKATHKRECQVLVEACAVAGGTITTTMVTTTNEDSDEYRSLEGKEDEAEFGAFD